MEISLEDTAVGRKKIVLEQQLNAATLSMSPTKWNELLEIRKQKWGEEGVAGATDEVMEQITWPVVYPMLCLNM